MKTFATNYTNWDEVFFFFVKIREIRGEDPPLYFTTRLVSSDSAPKLMRRARRNPVAAR